MHSDPIADMLTRVRNACRARKTEVRIPFSRVKLALGKVLAEQGYVSDVREVDAQSPREHALMLNVRYDSRREPVITDLQRVSTPGSRVYLGCDELPRVKNGLGIVILTTSRGLMTDGQARKARIGGEPLCKVW